MGGRGSASGISNSDNKGGGGKKYGTQYHTVLQDGNIKFVEANSRQSESLFETMTAGRVYVRVGGENLLQIVYFDTDNRRTKTIDLNHFHDKRKPHTHHGYEHNEKDSAKGYARLTTEEKKMVDRVEQIWHNYRGGR